jgi:hypothetical protein
MPSNFKEGLRRLGIVLGGVGAVAGAVGGGLLALDAYASAAKGLLGEPVWVDYTVAALLPVCGFVVPWVAMHMLVWIWAGFSVQPTVRAQGKPAGQ